MARQSYTNPQPNTRRGALEEHERRDLAVAREAANFQARWGYPRVLSMAEAIDRAQDAAEVARMAREAAEAVRS